MKALFTIFVLLLTGSVLAQELPTTYTFKTKNYKPGKGYRIQYEFKGNEQVITFAGELLSGVVQDHTGIKEVEALLRQDVPILLILYSRGGFLKVFDAFGRSLKAACDSSRSDCLITTRLWGSSLCASACVHFFMLGDKRIAGRNAKMGFHKAAIIPGLISLGGYAENELLKRGVNPEWIEKNIHLFETRKESTIEAHLLQDSGMFTEIVEY